MKGKARVEKGLVGCVVINELCCAADIFISDVQQKPPLIACLMYTRAEEHSVHFSVSHIYLPIKVSEIICLVH